MHKTLIVAVSAAAVAAAVLSASAYSRGQEFEDVFVVKESTETPTVVVSGSVVPFKEVTLAAQLPGRVKFIAGINPGSGRALPDAPGLGVAGGVIGLLSALLGIGGGSLTVPFLLSCKENIRMAVGTAAMLGFPVAVAGMAGFIVSGLGSPGQPGFNSGFVYWPAVAGIVLASVPLAPFGARLAHHLPQKTLQRVFALLLIVIGLKMVLGS